MESLIMSVFRKSFKKEEVDVGDDLENVLCRVVDTYHVTSAKQAVAVAEDLAFCADYSRFIPKIDSQMVSEYFGKGKVCF